MNYEAHFRRQLEDLRREGRYRLFADLQREVGAFKSTIGLILPQRRFGRTGNRARRL
jgi:hypothetical protein